MLLYSVLSCCGQAFVNCIHIIKGHFIGDLSYTQYLKNIPEEYDYLILKRYWYFKHNI